MAVEIKVTPAGESITHATLLKWLKPDGAAVKAGEPVCELETDKATKEEYAPAAGVLSISAQPGARLPIGAVIGSVDPAGTPKAAAAAPARPPTAPPPAARSPLGGVTAPAAPPGPPRPPAAAPAAKKADNSTAAAAPHSNDVRLSPAARVLVESQGIDASKIPASGRGA